MKYIAILILLINFCVFNLQAQERPQNLPKAHLRHCPLTLSISLPEGMSEITISCYDIRGYNGDNNYPREGYEINNVELRIKYKNKVRRYEDGGDGGFIINDHFDADTLYFEFRSSGYKTLISPLVKISEGMSLDVFLEPIKFEKFVPRDIPRFRIH